MLTFADKYIVTGSWRPHEQLQLWDLRTCKVVKDYKWVDQGMPCMLYAAAFSRDPQASMLLAGGSGANEARVYERESGELRGVIKGMAQGVYSLDCHPAMSQVAVASGDGTVRLINYPKAVGS